MKDTLTARVGRIISGGAHKLVEAFESAAPEVVMEQAIREIESVIDEVRAELGGVTARKLLASERLMDENRKHEDLSEKLELALKENREELAEAAIARQIDIEAQIPVLEATITEAAAREKELEAMISALQGRKREMVDDLRQFRSSALAQQAEASPARPTVSGERDQRVERAQSAFDRVLEKQTGLPGRIATTHEAQLAELEELARRNRVKERLIAAKAKLSTA